MAIFRLEAKIISRGGGHSAVAAAAYRTGTKLRDERTDKLHDYSNRTKSIVESVILRPDNSPAWTGKTSSLWNTVELTEKRKDAQLCREFILSLPKELDTKQQMELAVGWAQKELVSKGMVAEVSLHNPKGGKNPHVHILTTMRMIDGDHFSAKKPREWNDKALLIEQRASWAAFVNAALAQAGRSERVDHRSLKDRGLDKIPQPKIGKEAMGLQKRGVVADPERCKLVRWVKALNAVMPWARDIERHGEVQQNGGLGKTWWERSLVYASDVRKTTRDAVMDTWAKFVNRHPGGGRDVPPPNREPDLGR
ncbi:MAG: MobQ family relaxase [Verrucomicrobiota bacterium]